MAPENKVLVYSNKSNSPALAGEGRLGDKKPNAARFFGELAKLEHKIDRANMKLEHKPPHFAFPPFTEGELDAPHYLKLLEQIYNEPHRHIQLGRDCAYCKTVETEFTPLQFVVAVTTVYNLTDAFNYPKRSIGFTTGICDSCVSSKPELHSLRDVA